MAYQKAPREGRPHDGRMGPSFRPATGGRSVLTCALITSPTESPAFRRIVLTAGALRVSRRRLLLGPSQEFVESRTERLPPLREAILDFRRDFSVHNARHDAVSLQLPKLLGQHLLRDARNRALEVGETERLAAKEMEEDDELPATIQPSDGLLDPGGS